MPTFTDYGLVERSFATGPDNTPHDPTFVGADAALTYVPEVSHPSASGQQNDVVPYSPNIAGTTTIKVPRGVQYIDWSNDDCTDILDFAWMVGPTHDIRLRNNANMTGDPNTILNGTSGDVDDVLIDGTAMSTSDSSFATRVKGNLNIANNGAQFAGCDVANFFGVKTLDASSTTGFGGSLTGFAITGNSWRTGDSTYTGTITDLMGAAGLLYLALLNNPNLTGNIGDLRANMKSVVLDGCSGLTWTSVVAFNDLGSVTGFQNCGLSVAEVQNCLDSIVAGGVAGPGKTLNLQGNPGSATVAQPGNAAFDELVNNRGWTINT